MQIVAQGSSAKLMLILLAFSPALKVQKIKSEYLFHHRQLLLCRLLVDLDSLIARVHGPAAALVNVSWC